jgi:GTP pyrophosphokinase
MDRRAEEGIAAHWKYKEGRVGAGRDEQYFQWLRQLLEWQQEVRDPQEFLTNLKIDLYPEEVYTFTPRGQVKVLPRGSTPVDFAYAIHTDVGHHCVGARVNGRMVPLRAKLKNGDIVEIITNPGHKPSRDWLNFVATSRARSKIKHLIQSEEKERAVDLGRKLLEKEGRRYDINLSKLLDSEALVKAANDLGFQQDEIFAQIGYGKLSPKQLLDRLVPQGELKEKAPEHPMVTAVKRVLKPAPTSDRIVVRGVDDLMVFRARCCNPIRGEKIIGYITRGKGVAVHTTRCKNVKQLMVNRERIVEVEWAGRPEKTAYAVKLLAITENRTGMIAGITGAISDMKTGIRDARASVASDERGHIEVTVEVFDVKHLDRVIGSIKGVPGVLDVERMQGAA